jgi:ABC-type uncharacterized transport system involved in gliding motility auxiliary subunit
MERHKMKEKKARDGVKSVLLFGNILLPSLLVLGIFIFIEIISYNHNRTYDTTPDKKYTLSDQAEKVLNSLDDMVNLKTFYNPGEREKYDAFYQILSSSSAKIKYDLIDLNRNPGKARMLNAKASGFTVLEYKGKTYSVDMPTEESLINALLQLSMTGEKYFFILKGHGERKDIKTVKETLKHENWKLKEIFIDDLPEVSHQKSAVLMVTVMESDFNENEIGLLEKYLESGGKVVLLIEPFVSIPNIQTFLEQYGIEVNEGIIIDQKSKLIGGDYFSPIVPYYADVPAVSQVNKPSFFSTVRPLEIKKTFNSKESAVTVIASSSESSWAKYNVEDVMKGTIDYIEGIDQAGPIYVAAMVTMRSKINDSRDKGGEMICFGDSDFISDEFIEKMANLDFFMNAVEWLARDYELISVRQKLERYPYPFLSNEQGVLLFTMSVLVLPLIYLVTSIIILFYRRMRG